jgi:hypothetical protein
MLRLGHRCEHRIAVNDHLLVLSRDVRYPPASSTTRRPSGSITSARTVTTQGSSCCRSSTPLDGAPDRVAPRPVTRPARISPPRARLHRSAARPLSARQRLLCGCQQLVGSWPSCTRGTAAVANCSRDRFAVRSGDAGPRNRRVGGDVVPRHQKGARATSARPDRIEDGAATRENRRLAASRRPERK